MNVNCYMKPQLFSTFRNVLTYLSKYISRQINCIRFVGIVHESDASTYSDDKKIQHISPYLSFTE